MLNPEAGRYCGGNGRPRPEDAAREGVLWTHRICDDGACAGHWTPHAISRTTDRFVYVDSGPWDSGGKTIRLAREELEAEGRCYSRQHYRAYYTTSGMNRYIEKDRKSAIEGQHRDAMLDLKAGRRQMELGSSLDFHEVAPGIYKMGGADVYAHGARDEPCERCEGKGKIGRSKCGRCWGKGSCRAIRNYLERNQIRAEMTVQSMARDLEEVRRDFARRQSRGLEPTLTLVFVFNIDPAGLAAPTV
jgi:hypothetical protein